MTEATDRISPEAARLVEDLGRAWTRLCNPAEDEAAATADVRRIARELDTMLAPDDLADALRDAMEGPRLTPSRRPAEA